MASDQMNDQELAFKKRARRRLVGALALVLLMVTILPMVLDDKVNKIQQPEISITIPSQSGEEFNSKVAPIVNVEPATNQASSNDLVSRSSTVEDKLPLEDTDNKNPTGLSKPISIQKSADVITLEKSAQKKSEIEHEADKLIATEVVKVKNETSGSIPSKQSAVLKSEAQPKLESKAENKTSADKLTEKSVQQKAKSESAKVGGDADAKSIEQHISDKAVTASNTATQNKIMDSSFSLQLGVYSEAENVKKLQSQIQNIGYKSTTEKIQTAKGEKIRLKAGPFKTRSEAEAAESKVKAMGISTMIVTNK